MKEKLTDILITYRDKHTSESTQIYGDFREIVATIEKARRKGHFVTFNDEFTINPHYIITIVKIKEAEDE